MNVLHVIKHLHKLSGVSVFCTETCDALASCGVDVAIAIQNIRDTNQIPSRNGVGRICIDEILGKCEADRWDVVHIHNLWTPILHKASVWARKNDIPVIWSTHGTLSPWAFHYKWWKKFLPWHLYQKKDLHNASAIHITSKVEGEWVQDAGFHQHMVNIPLGTHLPNEIPCRQHDVKRMLFVGRIAPIKALPNLIEAWSKVRPTNWHLRIVGTEDFHGYVDGLKELCAKLRVAELIEFPGQRFGEDLLDEYGKADALVLPSYNENFGAVVIDAMAWGLPVIVSKGTPWGKIEEIGCGWWVDNEPTSLAASIRSLIALSDKERAQMGERGRCFVAKHYAWQAIANELKDVYESLVCG